MEMDEPVGRGCSRCSFMFVWDFVVRVRVRLKVLAIKSPTFGAQHQLLPITMGP